MRLAISGASGLIGRAIHKSFVDTHDVLTIVRKNTTDSPHEVLWDPNSGFIEEQKLAGIDCVIHLAGENIAAQRWTGEQKERIRSSRVDGTSMLASSLATLPNPPRLFIGASAIGYYGNRGSEELTEDSAPGSSFLSSVVNDWEKASQPLRDKSIRVVNARFGIVLSRDGGALKQMLPVFRFGLGGKLGTGSQYMSWITLSDVVRAIEFCIQTNTISGAVNVCSPQAVTNVEFTRTLGWILHRPTFFAVPAVALRLVLGEMANELLLSGSYVLPNKLLKNGFQFEHPELEPALRAVLRI